MIDIKELPIGFTLKLGQDMEAMTNFVNLTDEEKMKVVDYIQGATTGDEAKERVVDAIRQLHDRFS